MECPQASRFLMTVLRSVRSRMSSAERETVMILKPGGSESPPGGRNQGEYELHTDFNTQESDGAGSNL
jgi:hypothetical protein